MCVQTFSVQGFWISALLRLLLITSLFLGCCEKVTIDQRTFTKIGSTFMNKCFWIDLLTSKQSQIYVSFIQASMGHWRFPPLFPPLRILGGCIGPSDFYKSSVPGGDCPQGICQIDGKKRNDSLSLRGWKWKLDLSCGYRCSRTVSLREWAISHLFVCLMYLVVKTLVATI